jgi:hypothetical protein
MSNDKTHYRKAFNSPYLSSADIVDSMEFTIKCVRLEEDKTKKTKDLFNTAYFVEKEIRPGETLKPMILNVHNSQIMKVLTGSPFIDDWLNVRITIYVDSHVRFGRDTVEGLRISPNKPERKQLTPEHKKLWENAKAAYKRDKNLTAVLIRMDISDENQRKIIEEVEAENAVA